MIGYGLGDAGTGLAATQLGFYLFAFFTCTAGLPAFIAGSLLMVIKVWDAINDPLIGWLSDHTKTRWGPRLPWMLGGAVPLGISLAALWWVPPGGIAQRTTYYVVMAILLMTAYTSVNLPYAALSTELTTDKRIRTRLNAARFTGSILAGLSGLIVASLVLNQGAPGYLLMGRITGSIAAVSTLLCCWGLAPFAKKAQRPSGQSEPLRQQLRRIRANGRFLRVLGLYLLLWFGLQLMQVVALIYLVQVMRVPPELSTWILLPFQLSALVGLQLWSLLANRLGRVITLRLGRGAVDRGLHPLDAAAALKRRSQRPRDGTAGGIDRAGGPGGLHRLSDPLVVVARRHRCRPQQAGWPLHRLDGVQPEIDHRFLDAAVWRAAVALGLHLRQQLQRSLELHRPTHLSADHHSPLHGPDPCGAGGAGPAGDAGLAKQRANSLRSDTLSRDGTSHPSLAPSPRQQLPDWRPSVSGRCSRSCSDWRAQRKPDGSWALQLFGGADHRHGRRHRVQHSSGR